MLTVYLLIYIPILLFVVAFLVETYFSIARLFNKKLAGSGYVDATWEVTNTLLIFGVVMLMMLFTSSIDQISKAIFVPTMLAGLFLIARAACYIYIFYIKTSRKIGAVDWVFAATHVLAALCLVVTVLQATILLVTKQPAANQQFVPYFLPGLAFVLAICSLPLVTLYSKRP